MKLTLRSMFVIILAFLPIGGATAFAQYIPITGGNATGPLNATVLGGVIDPSQSAYGTGTDFGVNLTNAFVSGAANTNCQSFGGQRSCKLSINPTQAMHNISSTVTIPGGALLDCNGGWLNWTGPTNGVMFIFTNPAAEGTTIQNCTFSAYYSASQPYTTNTALWAYFGGDPNGIITPSTYQGFNIRLLNNTFQGFHAVIQGGNNWHNFTIEGAIGRHNDYFILDTVCGSNSGENMQIIDSQLDNGNLNFAELDCFGHEWKTMGTRWDYPNLNNVAGSQAAAGIIGKGINLQETNAHHEQSAGPMIYDTGNLSSSPHGAMLYTGIGGSYAAEGTYSGPIIVFSALHYGTNITSVGQQFSPGSSGSISTFADQTVNPDSCVTVINARDTAASPVWLGGACNMSLQNTPKPTCSATVEGTSWYTFGSGSTNGALQVCQNQSGSFTWVTH